MSRVVKTSLAEQINAEHRAFVGSLKKTAEHGIRAGELLTEAKSKCKHGEWLGWLGENFEGAPRTAQEYMRLYSYRDEIRAKTRSSAHLSISGALKEIAAPSEATEEKAEEKPEDISGLTDEQLAELVRDWMDLQGPTELSDIEQAAMDKRLAKPGHRERDLMSDIHYEFIMFLGATVSQDGFFIEEHDGKSVIEYREDGKLYRLPLVEPGKQRLDEKFRPRIERGAKVISIFRFLTWRLMSNWFAEVLAKEVDEKHLGGHVLERIRHNNDWRQGEKAGEYIRDRLLHEGFGEDKKLDQSTWALRHQIGDLADFEGAVRAVERVWMRLEAKHLEERLMGGSWGHSR